MYYYRLWKAEKAGAGNMMYQAAEHRQHFQEEKQQERESNLVICQEENEKDFHGKG